jgi:hypothetical protein
LPVWGIVWLPAALPELPEDWAEGEVLCAAIQAVQAKNAIVSNIVFVIM